MEADRSASDSAGDGAAPRQTSPATWNFVTNGGTG